MNIKRVNLDPVNQAVKPILPSNFNGIIIVGDVPYDHLAPQPFFNAHYGTVKGLCEQAGIDFHACGQVTLLPVYPLNGIIGFEQRWMVEETLSWVQAQIATGKVRGLLLLGRQTLKWFKPNCDGVDSERGAPFFYKGVVTVATLHPKEIYVQYEYYSICALDYAKLARLARDGWKEPELNITYAPSFSEAVRFLQTLLEKKPYISVDWESVDSPLGPYSVATCIGFGINAKRAFVIPFVKDAAHSYWTLEQECVIWRLVAQVLETCPQLGHNALQYDHWFAAYWCKILMHVVDDTMFAHWEIYTEHEKSLSFCASIYLDVPYWKDELKLARSGKVPRDREFLYNGRDCCINIAVATEVAKELNELPSDVKSHYRFNVRCSRIFQFMSLKGAYIDRDRLKGRIGELEQEVKTFQAKLNDEAGREIMVTSPAKMKKWLYEELRLPVRTKPKKQEDGSVIDVETADFLSLAYMAREFPDVKGLMTAALLRKLKKRLSSLNAIQTGPEGQCFWNFNLVGTDSGRASGYKPYSGLGVQPQNVDKRDRDLFLAGPPGSGYKWLKCDLEGADAWTVAGQLARLGDDTMLRDLRAGLKPALILAIAQSFGEDLITADQATLLGYVKQHKAFFKRDPSGIRLYDTSKSVSHGTNYMMQAPTMHMTIFSKTKGELFVPISECERARLLYIKRYSKLPVLYGYIPTLINSTGYIDCPSGMRRQFFGRADNHRTRVGLSLLPQNNTAYATNRLLHNLYYSSDNRLSDGLSFVLAPMNQVHDEADLAVHESHLDRARDIFKKACDFTSEIWGIEFKIPFDPNYGDNWGDCDEPFLGHD
jgi:uracil-DNA glycosylase